MATESYIERLQRQNRELIRALRSRIDWEEAMEFAGRTGRKGDAYRVADEKKAIRNEAYKIIEPLLAEKETKDGV